MADLDLSWQGDFGPDATGDLATVDGDDLTQQRFIRRLFTPVMGYIWHLEYGEGLLQKIGKVNTVASITSLVRAAAKLESTIAPLPIPVVNVTYNSSQPGGYFIYVKYWNNEQVEQTLTFDTTNGSIVTQVIA